MFCRNSVKQSTGHIKISTWWWSNDVDEKYKGSQKSSHPLETWMLVPNFLAIQLNVVEIFQVVDIAIHRAKPLAWLKKDCHFNHQLWLSYLFVLPPVPFGVLRVSCTIEEIPNRFTFCSSHGLVLPYCQVSTHREQITFRKAHEFLNTAFPFSHGIHTCAVIPQIWQFGYDLRTYMFCH